MDYLRLFRMVCVHGERIARTTRHPPLAATVSAEQIERLQATHDIQGDTRVVPPGMAGRAGPQVMPARVSCSRRLARGFVLLLTTALSALVAASSTRAVSPAPLLSTAVTDALDAMLACERPEGGWTYICERGVRTWGATRIVNTAERIAGPLGLASWDLVVLRSPGTPAAGHLLVRAYRRTRRPRYLAAAKRAGDLLVNLQLRSGGWFSEMPVHGTQLTLWFRLFALWTTLDDDVTPGAVRFLLALWEETTDPRYREAAERALDLLLRAQLPSGAWPLTWRPPWLQFLSPSFEDWASTNDATTSGAINAMLAGGRTLGREDLMAAARRGGDWILRARQAPPHAGWAQQYDEHGRPAGGRRFEAPALASWESRHAIETLLALAEATGDSRYCTAVPEAVRWLARSSLAPGCWARYYDPTSGRPFYVAPDGQPVYSLNQARPGYAWVGDFGIPALFASLGLETPGGDRPQQRLPGDSGVCAGEVSSEQKLDSSLSRSRIAGAAVLFARASPAERTACGHALRSLQTDAHSRAGLIQGSRQDSSATRR